MARKYLCIPATLVPSERAFSTAGNIVNAKRSCLLPKNTNILTFLAQNLHLAICLVFISIYIVHAHTCLVLS